MYTILLALMLAYTPDTPTRSRSHKTFPRTLVVVLTFGCAAAAAGFAYAARPHTVVVDWPRRRIHANRLFREQHAPLDTIRAVVLRCEERREGKRNSLVGFEAVVRLVPASGHANAIVIATTRETIVQGGWFQEGEPPSAARRRAMYPTLHIAEALARVLGVPLDKP